VPNAFRLNAATRLLDTVVIELSATGFHLRGTGEEVRWDEVTGATAFKMDLLATDLICLEFDVAVGSASVLVHEQMPGWTELISELPTRLMGVEDGWYRQVMLPAFATNARVIWPPQPTPKQ